MKIVKAGHEHISKEGLSPYQFIEKIGRTCYKSEDRITEDSAEKFVTGLVSRGHTAMIEHFWVHITCEADNIEDLVREFYDFSDGENETSLFRFMQVTEIDGRVYISCPIRAITDLYDTYGEGNVINEITEIIANVVFKYPKFFKDTYIEEYHRCLRYSPKIWDTESSFIDALKNDLRGHSEGVIKGEIMKHSTHTVLFTCNRGVSHELVRHRPCSFAQESTRYCNYSKDKFGREITVIDPTTAGFYPSLDMYKAWAYSCDNSEKQYFNLLDMGATPQEARGVLPNDLKTEIIMTANETEWQHIVNLRAKQTTGKAHPQMVEIMYPWYEELKELSSGRIE